MKQLIDLFNKKYGKQYGVIDDSFTNEDTYKIYKIIKTLCSDDEEIMTVLEKVKLPEPKTAKESIEKININVKGGVGNDDVPHYNETLIFEISGEDYGSFSNNSYFNMDILNLDETKSYVGKEMNSVEEYTHKFVYDKEADALMDENNFIYIYNHKSFNGTDFIEDENSAVLTYDMKPIDVSEVNGYFRLYEIDKVELDNNCLSDNVSIKNSLTVGTRIGDIGEYSVSEGYQNTASGGRSHAEGGMTTASGYASHAEGESTIASGYISHAEGENTTANGDSSHAEGYSTTASDYASHAEGSGTTASGTFSHAEGAGTTASGYASHAEGDNATVLGNSSHIEGKSSNSASSVIQNLSSSTTNDDILTVWKTSQFSLAKGEASHVEGKNCLALGDNSHAEGYYNTATGNTSHAEGYCTTANGNASHVEGLNTTASGTSSHAEGDSTTASGQGSHAEGSSSNSPSSVIQDLSSSTTNDTIMTNWETSKFSLAKGDSSHVEGKDCLALGVSSHAEGSSTIASNYYSHAEGSGTIASGEYSHAEGMETKAIGHKSHAEGYRSTALGECSHAEGFSNSTANKQITNLSTTTSNTTIINAWKRIKFSLAKSNYSHVEGDSCLALDECSHAEGNRTIASNSYCHSEGDSTKATGNTSHAEGYKTEAMGDYSHAEGYSTIASGENSHAEGYYTKASGQYQHVQGKYNIVDTSYAHIVGNGSSEASRSNAHTLDWNGNGWYAGKLSQDGVPTEDKDLATKKYVDEKTASIDTTINNTLPSNGLLTLTTDKIQTTTLAVPTDIALPTVTGYTEIHLFFEGSEGVTITTGTTTVRWKTSPTISTGNLYEIVFTYINDTIGWIGDCLSYSA